MTLNLLNPQEAVIEPDQGETVELTTCFTAQVDNPLRRDTVFTLNLTNLTTARIGVDFTRDSESFVLIIPRSFSGLYSVCTSLTIFGDDEFYGNRRVVYDITARSSLDSLNFADNGTLLIGEIIEDEGMHSFYVGYTRR